MPSPSSPTVANLCVFVILSLLCPTTLAQNVGLSPTFYDQSCPQALPTIRRVVENAVIQESRMGASLLRLHFHDCFVNGCDGSLLLDSTPTFETEKNSFPNRNSTRGFEVVDTIKAEVDVACGGAVVSCADILAVAARDSVVTLGGPTWEVQLGRRDSTTASIEASDASLPLASFNLTALLENFERQGLDATDLVVLSAGHTLGFSQCRAFRNRIYNDTNIDPIFASERQAACPREAGQGDNNLAPFDPTPAAFDGAYFRSLLDFRGLLRSDQELFNNGTTDDLVRRYSNDTLAFFRDFSNSMIKMGNISPLTGTQGQVRLNCRTVNGEGSIISLKGDPEFSYPGLQKM